MSAYEDIRHLSRPPSRHPKMKQQERAKIFSPFAALSGHEEAVHARDQALVPPMPLAESAQLLHISDSQRSYITNVDSSPGLTHCAKAATKHSQARPKC